MKIAHIADVHIRGLTRHAEYKTVFSAFIADVKEKQADIIFIGGDIFHTKTIGITPEYIDFMRWWLEAMAEVAPVHMVLGNHDGNLMNASRQDAVTPIVETLRNPRVFLYKKSGVYHFAPGMNWCVFSLFDEEGWERVKPVKGDYNIACFHGSVRGAKTEADRELDSDITVDNFKDYDLCLLGDIHKMQFLGHREYENGQQPWIGYPGSIIQQNFGEDLIHGYLMWDIEDRKHSVKFHELPNPNPFVTIEWQGSVVKTLREAKGVALGARYRVKSNLSIPQKDVSQLTSELKHHHGALEVTFKIDESVDRDVISTGTMSIAREDLRNTSVIIEMMREYYESEDISEEQWNQITRLVEKYMKLVDTEDEINRNTKWSIKKLEFDNMYCYGEKNVINFEKLSGITGIFGQNRTGKSSIIGALLYSLFNTSDRGSLKNLNLINERKDYCHAKSTVMVNGVDYLFERQTVKMENKKGPFGVTGLNAYKINNDGSKSDLNGEQRTDTDKIIRNLIGTVDDFMITGVSTQDDMKKFIKEGSSVRRQVISRFLDLDIFERVHDIVKQDVNSVKTSLKNLSVQDWDNLILKKLAEIQEQDVLFKVAEDRLADRRQILSELQLKESSMKQFEPTTKEAVNAARKALTNLMSTHDVSKSNHQRLLLEVNDHKEKLDKLEAIKKVVDIDELRTRYEAQRNLEATLTRIKHQYEKENDALARQEKSMLKLLEVPCGDAFPTCKFIKDSHQDKATIAEQRKKVAKLLAELKEAEDSLETIKKENILEKIKKAEQVQKLHQNHQSEIAKKSMEVIRLERELSELLVSLSAAQEKFSALQEAHENSENLELVFLKQEIDNILADISVAERQKIASVQQKGRLESDIEKFRLEKQRYEDLYEELKLFELVSNAFSKRGIPNRIIHSQLPIINHEISKILAGIINFTVELEADTDSNSMDIYINYGDSRRIIELGSGMEKVLSALAIRVALSIVSTLPKTDMLIIDEGFSDLDETQIETCNRMIRSLKKYFKNIIIITHLAGIKEVVDNMIEVTCVEHDSKVAYE